MSRRTIKKKLLLSKLREPSDTSVLLAPREKNLSQYAYERILDLLVTRELPAGSLVQERLLAEYLNISRTPVREALYRLETEGLLARGPGTRLVVKEFSLRELIEILRVRQILESEAAVLAMKHISPAELDAFEASISHLLDIGDPRAPENREVDRQFHEFVGTRSGNAFLAGLIRDLRLKTFMFNMSRIPERFEPVQHEHLAIIAALRAKDADAVRTSVASHIENTKVSIMRKLGAID